MYSNKKIKKDFDTVLKKKFLEKVDKYPFLDPFSGDFKYSNKKITFNAKIPEHSLSSAIYESIMELSKELEISDQFLSTIKPWSQKYSIELSNYAWENSFYPVSSNALFQGMDQSGSVFFLLRIIILKNGSWL